MSAVEQMLSLNPFVSLERKNKQKWLEKKTFICLAVCLIVES